jgi:hypothetical protein
MVGYGLWMGLEELNQFGGYRGYIRDMNLIIKRSDRMRG